ncbi:MAG: DegT/DnrJ/EryC1/StrS family aminotransferase [Burkholderiales bacterium]
MNITVTKPFLPPYADYQKYLASIWSREWLTNNGPLVNELELRLRESLGVGYLSYLSNGTVALQIAIRALGLEGEIVTTPFSYVATTSSIVWEHCKPVMADIDPETLNIDPRRVEEAIGENTCAILATHVFGNPCDVDALEAIARRRGIPLIYDAAHAFGTMHKGRSLLSYGDVATCSFHATKLFHTIEGGAVVTANEALCRRMELMRNFGHTSATEFGEVGINGKNSEVHAAMGLCNLEHIGAILERRASQYRRYTELLQSLPVQFQRIAPNTVYNHAYFPVIFPSEATMLEVVAALNLHSVFPRRYFYPSLSTLHYVRQSGTPVADDIARRVLCLPMYHTLSGEEIDMIARLIARQLSRG